jgi:hypothetical protein
MKKESVHSEIPGYKAGIRRDSFAFYPIFSVDHATQLCQFKRTRTILNWERGTDALTISQDGTHDTAYRSDDLHRHPHYPMAKPTNSPFHLVTLVYMLSHQERKSGSRGLGQRYYCQVRLTRDQGAHFGRRGIEAILRFFHAVFVVTPFIAERHYLCRCRMCAVGDIERVSPAIRNTSLAAGKARSRKACTFNRVPARAFRNDYCDLSTRDRIRETF